jgi:hypothetical protein
MVRSCAVASQRGLAARLQYIGPGQTGDNDCGTVADERPQKSTKRTVRSVSRSESSGPTLPSLWWPSPFLVS